MDFPWNAPWNTNRTPRHRGVPFHGSNGSYRRVLLVNPPMTAIGAEFMMEDVPLRLEYLAAYIRKHVEQVEVVDLTRESRPLIHYLHKFQPDLVGISVNYISTHRNALELAGVAKRFGAHVVVGGYQVTALADEFAVHPDVDFVVRGEGERTLLELVQRKPSGQIKGLSYCNNGHVLNNEDRPLIADLDSLPFPERKRRRSAYKLPFADLESDVSTAYDIIITSRGCWGKCKFCTEPIMSRGKQRYRKPEKVVEELEEIVRLHRARRLRVHIADPNFGGDLKVAEELCDRLIEFRAKCRADLRFFISVRTSTVARSSDLVRKMVKAGMDYVFVGIESPRKRDLEAISKRGESREKQERAVKFLKDNGAAVMSCLLLGIPGQTEQDILDLVKYAKELELEDCYFSVMTPLPGSRLYDEARQKDELLEPDYTKWKLYDLVFKHDILSRSKVRELCIRCNTKWYDDLTLKQEYRRWVTNGGRKKKLYVYVGKFKVLAGFLSFIMADADKDFSDLDPSLFLTELPNPGLRKFTEEKAMHNVIEMGRFLRILGDQKIQISLQLNPKDVVSWVIKTTPTEVEYLDAINGITDNPSIAINLSMNNGSLSPAKIVEGILRDNRDIKSRFNLARLVAASSSELLKCYLDKAVEALRCKVGGLVAMAKPGATPR